MFSGDPDFSAGTHALLNKDCELGRGGFGAVYRTVLGDGQPVAIKKLTVSSLVKSRDDFEREVKKLGKIRHRNLVQLEGYYWTPSLQLLIYEFLSGGSLYKHLHEKCDVYGFGVLVLEIITGRKPVEYMEDDVVMLCDTVRAALEEGKTEECIDESLQGAFPTDEAIPVVKLGLICTSQVPSNRPDMSEVVNILEMIRCPSEGQE
ncbi:Probable LRR receptor-like serine/threonine-protein kinase IRK [Linum perenne]